MMENNKEFEVAEHILQTCFWNNTNYTAQYILDHIDEKNFSRKIFSAIIENSNNAKATMMTYSPRINAEVSSINKSSLLW